MCSKGSEIHGLFSRLTHRRPWIPEKDKIKIGCEGSSLQRVSFKSWFLKFFGWKKELEKGLGIWVGKMRGH